MSDEVKSGASDRCCNFPGKRVIAANVAAPRKAQDLSQVTKEEDFLAFQVELPSRRWLEQAGEEGKPVGQLPN